MKRISKVISPVVGTLHFHTLQEAISTANRISRENPKTFAKAVWPSGRETGFIAGLPAQLCNGLWIPRRCLRGKHVWSDTDRLSDWTRAVCGRTERNECTACGMIRVRGIGPGGTTRYELPLAASTAPLADSNQNGGTYEGLPKGNNA